MSAIVNAASHRINTSVAGLTGTGELPGQAPGAPAPTSMTELLDNVPTEFGGLTHLFGGGTPTETPSQFLPVNVGLERPGGSVRGALGGLAPDFRNAAQKVQQAISAPFEPGPAPQPIGLLPPRTAPQLGPGFRQRWGGWWARHPAVGQWIGYRGGSTPPPPPTGGLAGGLPQQGG